MIQKSLFGDALRDLDPEIRLLAEKEELGELRKIYHASKRYAAIRMGVWIFVAWGIAFLFFAILTSPFHPLLGISAKHTATCIICSCHS
jgi:hypothetical protein